MLRPLPELPDPPSERDLAACRALLANGSRTFYAASFLLPKRVRDPATALYAFCRIADDLIDRSGGSPDALSELAQRLDLAYAGTPLQNPADRAFSATVHRYAIPRSLPDALIEGFEWDARATTYETISDLEAYAARVAGTVGAMMALVMGARSPYQVARACDLGIAMQLSNIARDVGEDARMGRLYLPRAWMREEGLDPDLWQRDPKPGPELALVVKRVLAVADGLYVRAEAGIARLPQDCRAGIYAARFLYAEIGNEVERRGFDSVTGRAVVSPSRKLRLLVRSATQKPAHAMPNGAAPVEAAQFLVSAAAGAEPPIAAELALSASAMPWWRIASRIARIVEIFERLERADQMRRMGQRIEVEPEMQQAVAGG